MSATVHLHDPQMLYRHWDDEQWNPRAIDRARDMNRWAKRSNATNSAISATAFWYLHETARRDAELAGRIRSKLHECSRQSPTPLRRPPAAAPTGKRSAPAATRSEHFSLQGLTRRLNIMGVPLTST